MARNSSLVAPRREPLTMWTVYDHPMDLPQAFVARKWEISAAARATDHVIIDVDIDRMRRQLREQGLVCIGRQKDDDPTIVEVWL